MVKDSHFSELGWRGLVVWNPEMHSSLLSSANSFSFYFYRLLCSALLCSAPLCSALLCSAAHMH